MPGIIRSANDGFAGGLLLPLLFLCVLYFLAGCSKSADDLYADGKRMVLDERTFDKGMKALVTFTESYPDDPRCAEVRLAIATAHQNNSDIPAAETAFNTLIDMYPDSDEARNALFLLGYMYYDLDDSGQKARETLGRYIERYPDSELAPSARVLIENIGRPVDDWTIIRDIRSDTRRQE